MVIVKSRLDAQKAYVHVVNELNVFGQHVTVNLQNIVSLDHAINVNWRYQNVYGRKVLHLSTYVVCVELCQMRKIKRILLLIDDRYNIE